MFERARHVHADFLDILQKLDKCSFHANTYVP